MEQKSVQEVLKLVFCAFKEFLFTKNFFLYTKYSCQLIVMSWCNVSNTLSNSEFLQWNNSIHWMERERESCYVCVSSLKFLNGFAKYNVSFKLITCNVYDDRKNEWTYHGMLIFYLNLCQKIIVRSLDSKWYMKLMLCKIFCLNNRKIKINKQCSKDITAATLNVRS